MNSFAQLPWYIEGPYKILRWLRRKGVLKKTFQRIKNWQMVGVLYEMHYHVAHKWRDLSIVDDNWEQVFAAQAKDLCNGCRDVIAEILGINSRRMHCTLKFLVEYDEKQYVATFGRSEPCNRDAQFGYQGKHLVSENSAFASILGVSDGEKNWQPYSYFTCNNLPKHNDIFRCDREKWQKWYKSTLVAPLRFKRVFDNKYIVLGFLTFDMHETDQFWGLPDIFETSFDDYHEQAGHSALINAAGIIADTLSVLLRPLIERTQNNGFEKGYIGTDGPRIIKSAHRGDTPHGSS